MHIYAISFLNFPFCFFNKKIPQIAVFMAIFGFILKQHTGI